MFYALFASMMSGKKIVMGVDEENAEGMGFLRQLLMKGQLKPVIDRIYPLEEVVDAHRYVDTGRKSGNVILAVG